jgi:hypothetical protein
MPADIAAVLARKREATRAARINETIVFVWATFGLALSTFVAVLDPEFALALIAAD